MKHSYVFADRMEYSVFVLDIPAMGKKKRESAAKILLHSKYPMSLSDKRIILLANGKQKHSCLCFVCPFDYGKGDKASSTRYVLNRLRKYSGKACFIGSHFIEKMERLREGRDNRRDATYESSITWDIATGVKLSETDINGNEMSYVYDGWQRLTEVRSPYDTGGVPAVRYRYHTPEDGFWYAVTENKVVTDANNTEVIKTFIQTDGLGRAIISAKTGAHITKRKS